MTAVYSDIAQYIADGNTPLQIVDLLRAQSVRVDNRTLWTFGLIESAIDYATAAQLASVIKSASATTPILEGAFTAMSTTGIELCSDSRQGMIEVIGTTARMTADQIAQVKALGVTYTAVDADATVESVQALIDAEKRQLWNARFDAAMNTIGTVEQADGVADLRLMADEMEA
jgi:hypothetical protein